MDWFTLIKRYYDTGRYKKEQLQVFVTAGKITAAQAKEILGE
ncbi:XkdX family protein [Paenibacillus mesotrionivorans]|uniref:XkdX family protein n=1 Tax=Paenibacillus mesotrionivorans TaxID=3160968 RepID=A0ACC7NXH0_9BACL